MVKPRFEHIISAVFFSIFFLMLNIFYERIQFLSDDFDQVLGFYNFVILIGIAFSMIQVFYANKYFDLLVQVVNNVLFVVVAYIFWTLFPFDTSVIGDPDTWDAIFRFLIIAPVFLFSLSTIGETNKVLR